MSLTEHIQQHNARYVARFDRSTLALPPARRWAIVACMDARLTVEEVTGIATGDAHIIRNAGGLVTDDAIRSLVISTHLLGTNEFAIIEHTGCGMLTFEDEPVRRQIAERTGADTADLRLFAFRDLEANLQASGAASPNLRETTVEAFLEHWHEQPELVVLDPPRTGVAPRALARLIKIAPREIVYLSCDPATLARDLATLVGDAQNPRPYQISEVHLVDIFPQTYHIEALVRLSRRA